MFVSLKVQAFGWNYPHRNPGIKTHTHTHLVAAGMSPMTWLMALTRAPAVVFCHDARFAQEAAQLEKPEDCSTLLVNWRAGKNHGKNTHSEVNKYATKLALRLLVAPCAISAQKLAPHG